MLEQFVEVMEKQSQILIEQMKRFEGQSFDIFPLMNLYTLDVLCGELF